jgi:glycosyltransferase involved in cell wall biosynthesis
MKIFWRSFLGENHSWSIVSQSICRQFKKHHQVDMVSTNGLRFFPKDLQPNLVQDPAQVYDLRMSYTAMKNFGMMLEGPAKKRFGIWAWEFAGKLPTGFAKYYKFTDKILAPSNFCKDVFVNSGIPADHVEIVPHGVGDNFLHGTHIHKLSTNKAFKFLFNIGQPHLRKGVDILLESWGQAFTKADDVALVAKVVIKKPEQAFEVYWPDLLKAFKIKYPNHAEIIVIADYIDDLSSLYRSCNALISTSYGEGFGLTMLEGLVSKKIVICPRWSAQLDFCNDNNSLLINGAEIKANPRMLYWDDSVKATAFKTDITHCAQLLRRAVNEECTLLEKFAPQFESVRSKYTWENVASQIINIYDH